MRCHHFNLFLLVLIVPMFDSSHGDPIPRKGKGRKSFGVGLLTGGLAGVAVGHVLTHKAQASKSESNKHVTTIQNGPIQPNGCFEQTVRESDPSNRKKFMETVNLVCPSAVPMSVLTPVSAVVLTPISAPAPLSQPPQTTTVNTSDQASPKLPGASTVEPIQLAIQQQVLQPTIQLPQGDTANSISTTSQHIPQQTLQSQPQMVPQATMQLSPQINSHFISQQIPQIATQTAIPQAPKVYVISKRTEYYNKKSAALSPILGSKFLINVSLIFLMLFMY